MDFLLVMAKKKIYNKKIILQFLSSVEFHPPK